MVFSKDIYHEENLGAMGLNGRQALAILEVKRKSSISCAVQYIYYLKMNDNG